MKNVYLWYVAVEGAKMAVVLGSGGSEGLAEPGNTVWQCCAQDTVLKD
jgi:hypothetical protein